MIGSGPPNNLPLLRSTLYDIPYHGSKIHPVHSLGDGRMCIRWGCEIPGGHHLESPITTRKIDFLCAGQRHSQGQERRKWEGIGLGGDGPY